MPPRVLPYKVLFFFFSKPIRYRPIFFKFLPSMRLISFLYLNKYLAYYKYSDYFWHMLFLGYRFN